MNAPLLNRLQGLTSMWCRLTGRSADDFNKEFFSRLGTLKRFTGQFPGEIPAGLIRVFEAAHLLVLLPEGETAEEDIPPRRIMILKFKRSFFQPADESLTALQFAGQVPAKERAVGQIFHFSQ